MTPEVGYDLSKEYDRVLERISIFHITRQLPRFDQIIAQLTISTMSYSVYFYGIWIPDWLSYEYTRSHLTLLKSKLTQKQGQEYIEICKRIARLFCSDCDRNEYDRYEPWSGLYFYTNQLVSQFTHIDYPIYGKFEHGVYHRIGPIPTQIATILQKQAPIQKGFTKIKIDDRIQRLDREYGFDYGIYALTNIKITSRSYEECYYHYQFYPGDKETTESALTYFIWIAREAKSKYPEIYHGMWEVSAR